MLKSDKKTMILAKKDVFRRSPAPKKPVGVVEAAGSNPVTQTISSVHNESDEHSIFFAYISLFGVGFLLFFLLLCRGGQIV